MSETNHSIQPSAKATGSLSSIFMRLHRRAMRGIHSFLKNLDWKMARIVVRSQWLSSLYFCLANRSFRREHAATLAGRIRFQNDFQNPSGSLGMLRRSIHRLEKGLLMRPMRPVFGLDYIQPTMETYERIVSDPSRCSQFSKDELKWVYDVLCRYFQVTGSHPTIDALRDRFQSLPVPELKKDVQFVPYLRAVGQPPPVTYEQLLQLSLHRRSVRWFLPKPVPRELIDKALAVATQSPSACNRQSFVFRIMDDPKLVRLVSELPAGTSGFAHNFPMIIVVVGRLRSYNLAYDRHVIYIDGSLASMSFCLALETLGLSSCCINWPDIEEREQAMVQALKLEPDERPIMLIAVGYPDPEGLVAYSQKKPPNLLGRYNFE